jgi:hypothetical protein
MTLKYRMDTTCRMGSNATVALISLYYNIRYSNPQMNYSVGKPRRYSKEGYDHEFKNWK